MEFGRSKRTRKPSLDMAPMIDIVFHVLIYFMVFSSIGAFTYGNLNVELPNAVAASEGKEATTFEISVTVDGTFYVADNLLTGRELRNELQATIQQTPDLFVIIKGDKNANYEYIVTAMDHAKSVGVSNIGLAVEVSQ